MVRVVNSLAKEGGQDQEDGYRRHEVVQVHERVDDGIHLIDQGLGDAGDPDAGEEPAYHKDQQVLFKPVYESLIDVGADSSRLTEEMGLECLRYVAVYRVAGS